MNKRLVFQLVRYFLALCCLVLLIVFWFKAKAVMTGTSDLEEPVPAGGLGFAGGFVSNYLTAVAFAVGVLVCLLPELVYLVSIPVRNVFSGIFFPQESEVAPPDYNVVQVYREQGRYEEAVEQYMKIIKNHPEELLAYLGAIECAHLMGDPELAEKIAKKGASLTTPGAREQIEYALQNPPQLVEEDEAQENEEELPPWYRQGQ